MCISAHLASEMVYSFLWSEVGCGGCLFCLPQHYKPVVEVVRSSVVDVGGVGVGCAVVVAFDGGGQAFSVAEGAVD